MTPSPLRGRWLWLTLAVIALDLLFLRLGVWQLQRLSERRVANARIVARTEQPALSLTDAPLDPAEADLRRAVVAGIYDPAHEIVLRNRTYNELPGVHVLTPLRIAGSDAAVLVDRGWIPYETLLPTGARYSRRRPARWRCTASCGQRSSGFPRCLLPMWRPPAAPPSTPGTASISRASRRKCHIRSCRCSSKKNPARPPFLRPAFRARSPTSPSVRGRIWVTPSNGSLLPPFSPEVTLFFAVRAL